MPEAMAHVGTGKVRELYALDDDRLLLVASDRISTFDVVLPTEIPGKGKVLTGLSAFWFQRTREICPNHLLGLRSDGRSTECERLQMLPARIQIRRAEVDALLRPITRALGIRLIRVQHLEVLEALRSELTGFLRR